MKAGGRTVNFMNFQRRVPGRVDHAKSGFFPPRHSRESGNPVGSLDLAGRHWVPAFAGMTMEAMTVLIVRQNTVRLVRGV